MDFLTLQAAKNYTDDTVEGMGIQKGKNCQIQNIEDITGGHRITFAWYDEDQVLQTDTVDIMNGPEGPEGPQGPQGEVGESGVFIGSEEDMPAGTRVRLDPNGSADIAAVINDNGVSTEETWSSKKISDEINDEISQINRDLSKLTKNNLSVEEIDIKAYTSASNFYTFPTDGYIYMQTRTGSGAVISARLLGNTSGELVLVCDARGTSGVGFLSLYVRKGMRVYMREDSDPSNTYCFFMGLE